MGGVALSLNGTSISRGIAIGKARIQQHGQLDILEYVLPATQIKDEIKRFRHAVETARAQLRTIRARIPANTPQEISAFIDTHLLMLDDATLTVTPEELIREHHCNAEWALKLQQDSLVQVFDTMDDAYLKTRRDDVEHVVGRIQSILLHGELQLTAHESDQDEARIVIASDLSPSDLVLLHQQNVAAIVTERGGPLSHTAILARSLDIPAVVGVHRAWQYIREGEQVVVDADNGALLTGLDEAAIKRFEKLQRKELKARAGLRKLKDEPARSQDNIDITLYGNIELSEDVTALRKVGAQGVGLYRTEFLYMNRTTPPDEEEQYQAYRNIIRRLKGAPITIRTLDLGADKEAPSHAICNAANPALGLRAIRLCLKEPELFIPQLRAIMRAAASGPVRMLIPMLTTPSELKQVLELIEKQKKALLKENKAFDPDILVGGMIEVPAAAICADIFARDLDFFSIGTNDLMQYTLATDRIDESVSHLFDPLNPGVLRLIHSVIRAGNEAKIPVAMCGEMAGDPTLTRLLLAMGLKEFSVPPTRLPEVKQIIRNSHIGKLRKQLGDLLVSNNSDLIGVKLAELNRHSK
jgi:phosphoenolpyruvate-protein phosphotransferase (PTS system enzyme I)